MKKNNNKKKGQKKEIFARFPLGEIEATFILVPAETRASQKHVSRNGFRKIRVAFSSNGLISIHFRCHRVTTALLHNFLSQRIVFSFRTNVALRFHERGESVSRPVVALCIFQRAVYEESHMLPRGSDIEQRRGSSCCLQIPGTGASSRGCTRNKDAMAHRGQFSWAGRLPARPRRRLCNSVLQY